MEVPKIAPRVVIRFHRGRAYILARARASQPLGMVKLATRDEADEFQLEWELHRVYGGLPAPAGFP